MLNYLENNFRETGDNHLADIIKRVRIFLGNDIPFPAVQALSIEEAVEKYIENPNGPEYLTELMRSFWTVADKKSGETTLVPGFPLSSKEINERNKQNQMAVFNGVSWVWIEKLVDSPNLNTTESQLIQKFIWEHKRIISIESYKVGGQIHKLLYGKYFDEGGTYSRVQAGYGGVLYTRFYSDGRIHMPFWFPREPGFHLSGLGGRFEEVIKKPIK